MCRLSLTGHETEDVPPGGSQVYSGRPRRQLPRVVRRHSWRLTAGRDRAEDREVARATTGQDSQATARSHRTRTQEAWRTAVR